MQRGTTEPHPTRRESPSNQRPPGELMERRKPPGGAEIEHRPTASARSHRLIDATKKTTTPDSKAVSDHWRLPQTRRCANHLMRIPAIVVKSGRRTVVRLPGWTALQTRIISDSGSDSHRATIDCPAAAGGIDAQETRVWMPESNCASTFQPPPIRNKYENAARNAQATPEGVAWDAARAQNSFFAPGVRLLKA